MNSIFNLFENKKKAAFNMSTMLGVGYCPVAPGTAGSLASLPVIFIFAYLFGLYGVIFLLITVFIMSLSAIKEVLKETRHDPSFIVIDEFLGQTITFLFVAHRLQGDIKLWWIYAVGFLMFRLFDVKKPFPINIADKKIKNSFGVILDDLLAGVFAGIFIYIISYILVLRLDKLDALMKM